IVSFVPMFFITGMMGPYMQPMALNVPLSMLMSLVVAFTITPWMSYHILRPRAGEEAEEAWELEKSATFRVYRAAVAPFLESRPLGIGLLVLTTFLLIFAMWL